LWTKDSKRMGRKRLAPRPQPEAFAKAVTKALKPAGYRNSFICRFTI
jgi:hypothetical protein